MSTAEDEFMTTSSDSNHSTYAPADDLPETNPPMGPQVIETRGLPDEAAPTRSSKTATAKAEAS